MKLPLNTVSARAKYIRMSPTKVRRVLKQIEGRSYKEALMILEFMPYAACKPVLLVVQSAGANAQNNNGLDKNMIRELSDDLSIRNGKFGAYVFYKTKTMKKPQFLNIKKFKESYLTCEKEVIIKWLEDNYPILKS